MKRLLAHHNPMIKGFKTLMLLCILCCGITSSAQEPFGILSATPESNSELSSIQEITIVFDFDEYKALNPTVTTWYMSYNFNEAFGTTEVIELKQGDDVIATLEHPANTMRITEEYTLKFESPIPLEDGLDYTLLIPEGAFSCYKARKNGFVASSKEIELHYRGKSDGHKVLSLNEVLPIINSVLESISTVTLMFNEDIRITNNKSAYLYKTTNDTDILATGDMTIGNDGKSVIISFDETTLYNSIGYTIEIPENTIYINDDSENGYQKIMINYTGASIRYFGYGRITPGNNRTLEYVGQITVPVNCSETEYLGRDFKAKANLYKLDDDELAVIKNNIECVVTENAQGFYVNVYDFNLEPSSTYQLVVDADQFCLWSYETEKPMRDTANEKLVLTYTTPDEIVPLPKQQFGTSTPSTDAAVESIESFKLMFEPYDFEDTFYYPVFSNYNVGYNVIDVVDQTTGDTIASFEVDIKWDDDNNYWLENIDALDITLLDGHSYNIVVPAGMFCCRFEPLHDLTLNDEYTITYQGAYKTSFAVNCNYGDAITLSNIVNRGEDATLKFNPSDEWDIDRVTVNYKEVEVSDNTLVVADVTEETNVYVAYRFVGGVTFDYTTGVESAVAECQYGISTDAGHVTITNITAGATVEVYNTVGMLMASSTATDSILTIGVNPGIVVVVIRDDADVPVAITVRVP